MTKKSGTFLKEVEEKWAVPMRWQRRFGCFYEMTKKSEMCLQDDGEGWAMPMI
jgi:hypothetical protein